MHTGLPYRGATPHALGGVFYNSSEFRNKEDILFFLGVVTVKVICPCGSSSAWFMRKRRVGLSSMF